MKLSLETNNLSERFGDLKAFELIKEAGFDSIDMSYPKFNGKTSIKDSPYYGSDYLEYAYKLRAKLDSLGLTCVQAHAPVVFRYGDSFSKESESYRQILCSLESASILGAKYIVVHAIGVPEGVNLAEYNREYYHSFIPYCEKFNIKIGVENLPVYNGFGQPWGERFGLPDNLSAFVKSLNQDYFVACIDLGHAALTYELAEKFIADTEGSIIKLLHVQECDFVRDSHTLPFLGGFNWKAILKNLKNKGYDGDLSFEIFKYFYYFPDELIPEALRLAGKTGRYLIDLYQKL